jgi:hypothetical protein
LRITAVPALRFDVDSVDLSDDQIERLFAQLDRQRLYLERLISRMKANGFPDSDPVHFAAWRALSASRELVLVVNGARRKGRARRFGRRAKEWE